jgi:hypothetical protein
MPKPCFGHDDVFTIIGSDHTHTFAKVAIMDKPKRLCLTPRVKLMIVRSDVIIGDDIDSIPDTTVDHMHHFEYVGDGKWSSSVGASFTALARLEGALKERGIELCSTCGAHVIVWVPQTGQVHHWCIHRNS